jgi:hypothetical protein
MKSFLTKTGKICLRCAEDLEEDLPLCFCKGYGCESILCPKHEDHLCAEHHYESLINKDMLIYAIIKMGHVIRFFAKGIDKKTFLTDDVSNVEFSKEEKIFTILLKDGTRILLFVDSKEIDYIQSKWDEHWKVILDKEKPRSICFFEFESY